MARRRLHWNLLSRYKKYLLSVLFSGPRPLTLLSFEQAYRKIGEQLQIPGLDDDKSDVKEVVKTRLSQESAGKWVMIAPLCRINWNTSPGWMISPLRLVPHVKFRVRASPEI